MAPINIDGTAVTDATIDGNAVREITAGGDVVFRNSLFTQSEADSKLVHRYFLNENSGPFEDRVQNSDGTNSGTTQVTGNFVADAARSGDGNDHINIGRLGSFGSNMATDFAVAFTFQTTETGSPKFFCGQVNADTSRLDIGFNNPGNMLFQLRDSDGDFLFTEDTNNTFNDGVRRRAVFNKTGNTGQIFISKTKVAETTNSAFNNPTDFDDDFVLFARNKGGGGIGDNIDAIIDDFCMFGDSLTQAEIDSYVTPF